MSSNPDLRILRQHVKTDQLLGVDAVPQGSPVATANANIKQQAARPATNNISNTAAESASPTAAEPASPPPAAPSASRPPTDEQRAAHLQQLQQLDEQHVKGCTKCPLHAGRSQTVFGEGDPAAQLMFIGEGPGQNEDEQGRPFVGRAGVLLNKQIAAMGLERKQVYIANIVKCRPPNNRAPTPAEVDVCTDYLRQQIGIIEPQVIVTLGGPAAKYILKTSEGITRIRGQWHQYDGGVPGGLISDAPAIPVMPTFHPAYLLRAYTEDNRRRVWSDLQQVMQHLGLEAPKAG